MSQVVALISVSACPKRPIAALMRHEPAKTVLAAGVRIPGEADRLVVPALQVAYRSALQGRRQVDAIKGEIEAAVAINMRWPWTPRPVRPPSPDF